MITKLDRVDFEDIIAIKKFESLEGYSAVDAMLWAQDAILDSLKQTKEEVREEWKNWFFNEQTLFNPKSVSESLMIASWTSYKRAKGIE